MWFWCVSKPDKGCELSPYLGLCFLAIVRIRSSKVAAAGIYSRWHVPNLCRNYITVCFILHVRLCESVCIRLCVFSHMHICSMHFHVCLAQADGWAPGIQQPIEQEEMIIPHGATVAPPSPPQLTYGSVGSATYSEINRLIPWHRPKWLIKKKAQQIGRGMFAFCLIMQEAYVATCTELYFWKEEDISELIDN